jgi:hypothetical protein
MSATVPHIERPRASHSFRLLSLDNLKPPARSIVSHILA